MEKLKAVIAKKKELEQEYFKRKVFMVNKHSIL